MYSEASNYAARVNALWREYSSLAANPANPQGLRVAAEKGRALVLTLIEKVNAATSTLPQRVRVGLAPFLDGQILSAEAHLRLLKGSGRPGETMGIWSWNPNLWGLTPEQANAYELANAQNDAAVATADAQASAADPSILDTLKQSAAKTAQGFEYMGIGLALLAAYMLFGKSGKTTSSR